MRKRKRRGSGRGEAKESKRKRKRKRKRKKLLYSIHFLFRIPIEEIFYSRLILGGKDRVKVMVFEPVWFQILVLYFACLICLKMI